MSASDMLTMQHVRDGANALGKNTQIYGSLEEFVQRQKDPSDAIGEFLNDLIKLNKLKRGEINMDEYRAYGGVPQNATRLYPQATEVSYPEQPLQAPPPYSIQHEITIKPQLHGYIVKVGCQTLVFETVEKMARELERYYKNPQAVEDEYRGIKKPVTKKAAKKSK